MKIELEVPDWCEGGYLYVMKGVELVAYKWPKDPWRIKIGRCSKCGKCCMIGSPKRQCEHLKLRGTEMICSLGSERPWSCSIHHPDGKKIPDCTERFE